MGLSGSSLWDVIGAASTQLWTPKVSTRTDGFYELAVTNKPTLTLNGLWGNVRDGTFVAIYDSSPYQENAIWKVTATTVFCFP